MAEQLDDRQETLLAAAVVALPCLNEEWPEHQNLKAAVLAYHPVKKIYSMPSWTQAISQHTYIIQGEASFVMINGAMFTEAQYQAAREFSAKVVKP